MDKNARPRAVPWKRFLIPAFLVGALFVMAHAVGLRSRTGVLSGTDPVGFADTFLGIVYILLYLGTVVLVPVLLITFALVAVFMRFPGMQRVEESGQRQK